MNTDGHGKGNCRKRTQRTQNAEKFDGREFCARMDGVGRWLAAGRERGRPVQLKMQKVKFKIEGADALSA